MLNLLLAFMMIGYIYEDADSLLVMGNDSLLLGDYHQYNLRIHVWAGGKILVRPWNGFDTTGRLILIAPHIDIHGGGAIAATGCGYWGGNNSHPSGYGTGAGNAGGLSGGAGGGGAYGGSGGDGGDQYPGAGGTPYGSISDTVIEMGSGGGVGRLGAVDGLGGNGGAYVYLKGRRITLDSAQILVRGNAGLDGNLEAGGAGSGGGIMIRADTVQMSHASLNGAGGTGGSAGFGGGGGGGGGRIKVFYTSRLDTASVTVGCQYGAGGAGDISNGGNGETGTIYIGPLVAVDEFSPRLVADWMIIPNPGRGRFAVINPVMENRELVIYDIQGRTIRSHVLARGRNLISLDGFPAGVYMIRIEGFLDIRKLLVVK
jgi:hypothetical protein